MSACTLRLVPITRVKVGDIISLGNALMSVTEVDRYVVGKRPWFRLVTDEGEELATPIDGELQIHVADTQSLI